MEEPGATISRSTLARSTTSGNGNRLVAMDDEAFVAHFEAAHWKADQWHHREHIKIAYLYLRRYSFEEALFKLRKGIQALNAAQGVPETPERGYHETMTRAWLRLVHVTLGVYGPAESADQFYEQNPQLSQKKALRLFYSPQQFSSQNAKFEFVEPDLAPLPRYNGK